MVSGVVRSLVPIVPLAVVGRDGTTRRFQAVLDTGFTGAVALPAPDVQRLGLANPRIETVRFANGESDNCEVYFASVLWDGEELAARVYAIGNEPLVGMHLLDGARVTMDVAEGGRVEVEPL